MMRAFRCFRDVKMMGLNCSAGRELRSSDGMAFSADAQFRLSKVTQTGVSTASSFDDRNENDDPWLEG